MKRNTRAGILGFLVVAATATLGVFSAIRALTKPDIAINEGVILPVMVGAAILVTLVVIAALVHLVRRRDLAGNERLVWAVALVFLPGLSAVVYCGLGKEGSRDAARRIAQRFTHTRAA